MPQNSIGNAQSWESVTTLPEGITLSQAVERETAQRISFERLTEEMQIMENFKPIKKSNSIDDTLNEIAKKNDETFKKIKDGYDNINDFRNKRIKELSIKYDTLLFNLIGKNYTLEGKDQVSTDKNIKYLTECINSNLMRHLDHNKDLGYFKESVKYYMSRRVLLDKKIVDKIESMSIDLYDYIIEYIRIKEENEKLIGKCNKVNTVCEDYLNRDLPNTRNVPTSNRPPLFAMSPHIIINDFDDDVIEEFNSPF